MTSARSTTTRTLGSMALGMLIALGGLEPRSAAAAGVGKKACTALERRLDGRLRRGLKGCGKGAGALTALRCAGERRAQHVAALAARGCGTPLWAVAVETVAVDAETVALVWTSRLNWARILVRRDDPIASSVRIPNDRFRNLLLLDRGGDVAAVVDYVEDVEGRAVDIEDGLPSGFTGASGTRGAFPGIGDRGIPEAVDALLDLAQACAEGTPSLFGRDIGGVSPREQKEFNNDPGATAVDLAYIVRDIIRAISDDDPPPSDPPADDPPPAADDGQCVENADGKCNEGGENPDDGQSQEGSDDPQNTSTTSTTLPPPPPTPPGGGQTTDPGSDGESCAPTAEAILALCEQADWQTPSCRAVAQTLNGCVDESLINPGPEGEIPCSGDGMSEEELRQVECEQQGGIAQPGPDGELLCLVHDPAPAPSDLVAVDPCNSPETQGTAEMCADQGGVLPEPGPVPAPKPDPRAGALRSRF